MDHRDFGTTGLRVSALGLGCGGLGRTDVSLAHAERVVHAALLEGVTFFDTAPSYGDAEEKMGRIFQKSRPDVVLSTKVGYGVDGVRDWTGEAVALGIDGALQRLRTDWIDVVHLHSCPREVAQRDDILDALHRARMAGKFRVAAYSGEGDALAWAVQSGEFGSVQVSVNVCDQGFARGGGLWDAKQRGLGVVAKRPTANGPWRSSTRPHAPDRAIYWDRWTALNLPWSPTEASEKALRFTAFRWGVDVAVVGTTNPHHIEQNARWVQRGVLPEDDVRNIEQAFDTHGWSWDGVV